MSKKANPALIGGFVLGAVVLMTAALIVFGSGSFFQDKAKFVLYFKDSVNGLATGAPVKFKGVPIGQVTDILITFNQKPDDDSIPVIIEIDIDRLQNNLGVNVDLADPAVLQAQIADGLRAKLQQASFVTGLLFVELNYEDPSGYPGRQLPPPEKHQVVEGGKKYLEIPTLQSGLTEIIKKVSKTLNNISQIDFANMGRRLNDLLDKLDRGVGQVNFKGISDDAQEALQSINDLANNADLKKAFANLDKTLAELQDLINSLEGDLGVLVQDVQVTLKSARTTLDNFSQLADSADSMVEPDSPLRYELTNALAEFAGAMRSLRVLADYLEQNPDALLTGKQSQ